MNVTGFTLYNAATNEPLQTVAEGDILDFNLLANQYETTDFTIVCETEGPVQSTLMTESRLGTSGTDNDAPYSLAPGTGADVGVTPFDAPGNYGEWTVTCQPFCLDGGADSTDPDQVAGIQETVNFRVRNCLTCNTECINIVGKSQILKHLHCVLIIIKLMFLFVPDFVMVDADTDLDVFNPPIIPEVSYLFSIEEGATYSLAEMRATYGTNNFALVCVTDPRPFYPYPNPNPNDRWRVGSVGLRDNYDTHLLTTGSNPEGKDFNSENSPPYTLADDDNGNYDPTNFLLGEPWEVTCQAFCERNIVGEVETDDASVPVTRRFTITNDV